LSIIDAEPAVVRRVLNKHPLVLKTADVATVRRARR
jgi:hypothetical protein